jgi:DNA-directed RNA polymerase specialized sigma subunit
MNAREYLSRYHNMRLKLEKLEYLHEDYIRMSHYIPGVQFDLIRVSGTKSLKAPFEKWVHKAMEVHYEIEQIKEDLQNIKNEILSAICDLENIDYKRILIYRYIDWLSWREIADKMFYSSASIRRMHDKAIEEIVLFINGKDEQA